MKDEEFYRIGRLPPYVLAEVTRMRMEARASGQDIMDFGMGNPDSKPPQAVIDKLSEVVQSPRVHGYSMSRGIPGLRKAHAAYYERRFNVAIDPDKEVIVTLGSKEGLANLAQAITKPGDVILVPNPSYPIHPYGFVIAGASVAYIPKIENQDFFTVLKETVENSSPKPLALVLNYPCNPTTETVGLDFYEQVVDFCKHHDIYILSDLAYCEIYFGDTPPPSILEVKGAKDIAVEFTSLSKTYSMAGWRVGFAAGNQKLVSALTRIKSYLDYGGFTPIQVAATTALNHCHEYVDEIRTLYKERRDIMVETFRNAGWDVPSPDASMFIWSPLPDAFKEAGSLEFSKLLLKEANVAVAPGIGFGKYGEGYVRIALVENKQRIRQAARNIKQFLKQPTYA